MSDTDFVYAREAGPNNHVRVIIGIVAGILVLNFALGAAWLIVVRNRRALSKLIEPTRDDSDSAVEAGRLPTTMEHCLSNEVPLSFSQTLMQLNSHQNPPQVEQHRESWCSSQGLAIPMSVLPRADIPTSVRNIPSPPPPVAVVERPSPSIRRSQDTDSIYSANSAPDSTSHIPHSSEINTLPTMAIPWSQHDNSDARSGYVWAKRSSHTMSTRTEDPASEPTRIRWKVLKSDDTTVSTADPVQLPPLIRSPTADSSISMSRSTHSNSISPPHGPPTASYSLISTPAPAARRLSFLENHSFFLTRSPILSSPANSIASSSVSTRRLSGISAKSRTSLLSTKHPISSFTR